MSKYKFKHRLDFKNKYYGIIKITGVSSFEESMKEVKDYLKQKGVKYE